ncbi:putative quinol monooxygenase [Aquisalimonas lutea]|uniref:putative quinol monooxygenase n=1 Tax=Aquisalimonas lutea TaxID=1327750 RepID=UPI00338F5C06
MIIVSGRIYVYECTREDFLALSRDAILQARKAPGCQDFIVAADPIEPDRVNVYEEWETEEQLLSFRGSGPNDSMTSVIKHAAVYRHQVSSSSPA